MSFGLGVLLALAASVPERFASLVRTRRRPHRNCSVCGYPADHPAYSSLECEVVCKKSTPHVCKTIIT